MDFPQFQVPYLGHGMVIGGNAVIHVILSHWIAIGVFATVAIAELIGYRKQSASWEHLARFINKPITLIISSVGAVTGVGIWFTICVLAPRAATSMLHIFFWPCFIEWIVFTLEAIILIAYYYLWSTMNATSRLKKLHIAMGFSYVVLAFASAFLITGIIGFMLTPDGWPWDRTFACAFFNPSLWPQTFIRFLGGLALGIPVGMIFLAFWKHPPDFKRQAYQLYGSLLLLFGLLTGLCVWWYFRNIPPTFKTHKYFALLTSHLSQQPYMLWVFNGIALGLIVLLILFSLIRWRTGAAVMVIPAILSGVFFTAEFERIREFIRGPYVMPGYMYANQVLVKEVPYVNQAGSLSRAFWFNAAYPKPDYRQTGQALFANSCLTCHTIGGLNNIKERFKGRPQDSIAVIEAHTNEMVPFMPPFVGTVQERLMLSQFLYEITNGSLDQPSSSRYPSHKGQDDD